MERMIKEQLEEMRQLIALIPSHILNNYNQHSVVSYSEAPHPQANYCHTPQSQMSFDINTPPPWPSNNAFFCGDGATACDMNNSNNGVSILTNQAEAPSEQQLIIRNLLPIIQRLYPNCAGIIKDTLLRMDTPKLLHMLENDEFLREKLEEIVAVVTTITYSTTGKKKILWKYFYPNIMSISPINASKITRILLNCDYTILLDMLINTYILKVKVEEAKTFLIGPPPKIKHLELCMVPLIKKLNDETDHIHLEFDNCKLSHLLKHNEWFKTKVEEAMSELIVSSPDVEQREILKSCLSHLIKDLCPFYAEAVTGKLLESNNLDMLNLLKDHQYLVANVERAIEELIDASPAHEQRVMLGHHLYRLVQVFYPNLAHIITEMLLDYGKIEVLEMLKSEQLLKQKAAEAMAKYHSYHPRDLSTVPAPNNM